MSKLVVVESPSKAQSIKKYLGSDYKVMASVGHIRDLPKNVLGVNIDQNFKPKYVPVNGKEDLIKELTSAAADSDFVYLATDPDREGEAIAWHLSELLGINGNNPIRVTFNEITKSGITQGMSMPRGIDMNLVDAQQARRILDRIVGYKLSPFLWKKVRRGLSAGRVQSVVVKLIVDREEEIRKFIPEEYWTLDAKIAKNESAKKVFDAKLTLDTNGKKIEISNEQQALKLKTLLENADYYVKSIKKGVRHCKPTPPFITSSLQQEASRKFNMTGERTMRAAQNLYEGVNIPGRGTLGLITYMRTDSVRISNEARVAGEQYIKTHYGNEYLPSKSRFYKTRSNAQDGHEAIRPTTIDLSPADVKDSLTPDQFKIYKLVWERFIASLMSDCIQNTQSVDIEAENYIFRATGYTVKFDGFTVVYQEGKDTEDGENTAFPELTQGEKLNLRELIGNQHFTQPPARYTDASLIEKMEKSGIGRPSTYAPTIATIIKREYVVREKKALKPTQLGEVTTGLMRDLFKDIVDTKFTASMEQMLDSVASGELGYVDTLSKFYGPFIDTLEKAEKKMDGKKADIPVEETGEVCEKCGKKMIIKFGRFGKFAACSGYPECKTTKPLLSKTKGICPKCSGAVLEKKSKRGYKYFGCENNTKCDFMTWDTPLSDLCPKCNKTLYKRRGGVIVCNNEGCDYEFKPEKKSKKDK